MSTPQLGGSGWRPLFTPVRTGVGVNDHCVVRAQDGRWHVFGITQPELAIDPQASRWFCHGSGPSLAAASSRSAGASLTSTAAWAPTVAFDGEQWVMLYGPNVSRGYLRRPAPRPLAGGAVLGDRRAISRPRS